MQRTSQSMVYIVTALSVIVLVTSFTLVEYTNTYAAIYATSSVIGGACFLSLLFIPKVSMWWNCTGSYVQFVEFCSTGRTCRFFSPATSVNISPNIYRPFSFLYQIDDDTVPWSPGKEDFRITRCQFLSSHHQHHWFIQHVNNFYWERFRVERISNFTSSSVHFWLFHHQCGLKLSFKATSLFPKTNRAYEWFEHICSAFEET